MRVRLLLLAAAMLAARAARAETSIGGDWTTGYGYRGFDLKGALDLDAKKTWEADLSYAYAHSKTGTESRSNQLAGSVYHDFGPRWNAHGGLTHWRDTLNAVGYNGPSLGASYAAYPGGAADHDLTTELWRASADADLFFYSADATTAARTVRVGRRAVRIPPQTSRVGLTQFHPSLTLEKPLVGGMLTPWASAGYYFYSKDPAALEQRAGDPRFAASAASVNGLVGGLLRSSGQVGLDLRLPFGLKLGASLGVQRIATDGTWATTQGASAKAAVQEHVDVSASWSRTIQYGLPLDLVAGGASWVF